MESQLLLSHHIRRGEFSLRRDFSCMVSYTASGDLFVPQQVATEVIPLNCDKHALGDVPKPASQCWYTNADVTRVLPLGPNVSLHRSALLETEAHMDLRVSIKKGAHHDQ